MTNRQVLIFNGINSISDFVADKWSELSKEAISESGKFTVAVSGGKTPVPVYRRLSEMQNVLPWDKTHIFLVDERFVPHKHPERNFRMIRENLLKGVNIPEKNIYPLKIKKTPEESAEAYEKEIIDFFSLEKGEFPVFDMIMLGIGEDGHTASLFPGNKALCEKQRLTSSVTAAGVKLERITLTLPVINKASNIMFLIAGGNKARPVKMVLEDNDRRIPAYMVKPERGNLYFLLDNAAGSLLRDKEDTYVRF